MEKISSFVLIVLMIACTKSRNPMQPQPALVPTLVTAWYPNSQSGSFPEGQALNDFVEILELPVNIIVFGNENLKGLVKARQSSAFKKLVIMSQDSLIKNWYFQKSQNLERMGFKKVADRESEYLTYSRMNLLKKAAEQDPYNSDELIWVDFKAFKSPAIQKLVEDKNLVRLITKLDHHFFFVTQPKDDDIHVYPNVQRTYFNTTFTTFVGGTIFGGRKQSIQTIAELYSDLLRVVIQYDMNLWHEAAILSLLANRCYYLTSYLTLEGDNEAQSQQGSLSDQFYSQLLVLVQIGLAVVGLLLVWEIKQLVKTAKQQGNSVSNSQMDTSNVHLEKLSGRQIHEG